ncbi:MAG: AAA family ATPase [Campylobacterales bacterium]
MTQEELATLCIKQTSDYLNASRTHNLGIITVGVRRIRQATNPKSYLLHLDSAISPNAKLILKDQNEALSWSSGEDLIIESWDEGQRLLLLSFIDEPPERFDQRQLVLESDMTFLLANLLAWYEAHASELSINKETPSLRPLDEQLDDLPLNNDQIKALELIASSGLSYIWGPPGTGKTQAVLAHAVIAALRQQQRILILAPTNKALEQAFEGVITRLKAHRISPTLMLRLGVASSDFARRYPALCESSQIEREYDAIEKKMQILHRQIEQLHHGVKFSLLDDDLTEEQINNELAQLEIIKEGIKTTGMRTKIPHALILGMTLDHYIGRTLQGGFDVDHIFLDEAGYASLAKALPLFAGKTPITMLGDHCQLPPVSPMPPNTSDNQFYLFSVSAIYAETLFSAHPKELPTLLNEPPRHEITKRSPLTLTHRFGSNLATLLDRYIYKNGFRSSLDGDLQIDYIDTQPFVTPTQIGKREAWEEAVAIASFVKSLPNHSKTMILTPYQQQAALLRRTLGRHWQERIATIHKSQGQEWETVIFSIVDNSWEDKGRRPWFTNTNSTLSAGLNLINTVISRAKKRLILVGDYTFWSEQEGQLLAELFRIASKIS